MIASAAALLVSALHAQPRYAITEIGVLPGASYSIAHGLNDAGDVAGTSDPGMSQTAFLWRAGTLVSLGKLTNGNYSTAAAINMFDTVVGDGDTGNNLPQAWVTTASGLYNFFPNNGGNTHAIAINNSGAICGQYTKSLSGNTSSWRGAIWTVDPKDPRKYVTFDLPVIPGNNGKCTNALPWAFNNLGEAAGWATNDIIGQHAALWRNDAKHTIVDLGTFPGDWSSIAWGMNDLSQVVGVSHTPTGGDRAVLWQNDATRTAIELPPLPGDTDASAQAINTLGQVIGTSYDASGGYSYVIWIAGLPYDLETLLDPTLGAGWVITSIGAINSQGQIAGAGMHNGVVRGFVLTPVP